MHTSRASLQDFTSQRVPYLSALEVWSRQGAIQIYVYIYIYNIQVYRYFYLYIFNRL